MIVTVKNGFCEKLFMDENGNLLVALRNPKLFGPEKAVVGPDKAVHYETDVETLPGKPAGEDRRYILKHKGMLVATALPVYAADADHFAIPRPPRPIGLNIQMDEGVQWRVVRGEKNSLEIHTPSGIGTLRDYFSILPQPFEMPDESDVFLWAGVYALAGYMMHEDDVMIV